MLLDDLRAFLLQHGYGPVFQTQYPDEPDEMISVHEHEHPMALGAAGIHYGIRAASISIRVRRQAADAALAAAWAIFALLDSGGNERPVALTPERSVTSRPRPPFYLEIDAQGRVTYVVKTTLLTGKP